MHSYFKRPSSYQARLDSVFDYPDLTIVIPSFKETNITDSLKALAEACRASIYKVHLIIVINQSAKADADTTAVNLQTKEDILAYQTANPDLNVDIIEAFDLPPKKAGVGLARKIGLDEAAFGYHIHKINGVIACFDADSTCSANYIRKVVEYFQQHEDKQAVSIYFEHLLDEQYSAQIINYELHLRLYINFQKFIGLPFAYHTVGSSMAIRSEAYISKGGMNTRKAGEDFYFLHKFIEDDVCGELYDSTIFPSSRVSDRVPFGTGRAILEMTESGSNQYFTYHPQSYLIYQAFTERIEAFFNEENCSLEGLHPALISFLEQSGFGQKLEEIKANTNSYLPFKKRFFKRFNAFYFMKYLHYMRDHLYPDVEVVSAAKVYFDCLGCGLPKDAKSVLQALRKLDKKGKSKSSNKFTS